MPTASLVSVGTELLFGHTINTNSAYISEKLQTLGISVLFHHTVGDNPARVKNILELAMSESDIVITTGGLGPTQDDLTKELIAEVMNAELIYDDEAMQRMTNIFKLLGRKSITENNKKQAFLPEGSTVFYNGAGTAPGFALEKNGKTMIAMPGPPREMSKMMDEQVIPYLSKKANAVIFQKTLRFYGIGESALETALLPVIDGQTDPTIATYAKEGECAVRIASMRHSLEEAEEAVDKTIKEVKALAGEYLYSEEDENLPEVVLGLLKEKGLVISSAESCTGGLFASSLTAIPGASEVVDCGLVTYSNSAKMNLLGVEEAILNKYGAVSAECAEAMAKGLRARTNSDIAISVTGIAGPDGGSEEKPVGLVFFGLCTKDKCVSTMKQFHNRGRKVNQHVCVLEMLNMVRQLLID